MEVRQDEEKSLRKNITALGWVAFFGGLSQDMIAPILPTFYSQILGLNKEMIGIIEGSVTTAVSIMRILSGIISDKIGKRKTLVFIGYLLSALGRILLSITNIGWVAFGLRLTDGVGKGMKDAPRDALVARSSKMKNMGFAFGYQRMLDTLGSFIGPLITAGLLAILINYMNVQRYKFIFLIAGIVAFITILLVGLFVKERKTEINTNNKFSFDITVFKGKFLLFFIVMLIFTFGNSSDAFLILRAQNVGVKAAIIPVIIAVFNLIYAILSVPFGVLSDKIGRVQVIKLGWLIYALVYLGFALVKSPWQIWILYIVYGAYYAMTEGVAKSLVAHLVDDLHRGTAFGLYNASLGLLALPASAVAGYLWDKVTPAAPFYFGFGCAVIAVILLSIFRLE
ncbi:Na+/melibiose symporter [Caldanaerobius fijiensis DSM 17918]|uniref:Na+/melibiose symporter n=1 Tax=Caldanaerobius fijiensis DSM 17918 TaxID=1121256 RepID=A0A1M4SU34_9THEO|nr:MFS transporter [Caldanaerobius fijiensis]SHE35701.1 Na+/melibiose symporter [Caldanaerobius fijiensis DSM 17918]